MHNFEYSAPRSLDDALALLGDADKPARLLAGGTDLIVQMRVGARTPQRVIDAKLLPELNVLELNNSGLTVGSAVSCRTLYKNGAVAAAYPALVDSGTLIGGVQIQGRASFGGNLCNAAPSADTIPPLIVLGAVAQIRGPNGAREVPAEEFCVAPGKTVLAADEILVSLKIPPPPRHGGAFFLRFIPRNEMDIAVVNAAASVVLNAAGDTFESARIAIGAVAPTPLYVEAAGAALAGKPVADEAISAASKIARDTASPIHDMRGTIEHRKHLTEVLTTRALRGAIDRARGEAQ